MSSENNKRIAKNTLFLYFRMILTMGVSLFTVRVVLDTLGTIDYGLYNVVGGVVIMFGFLSGTMATASQRFFSFELGRKNFDHLKKTFSITMTIYAMIAVIILILAETLGLWFLNTKMTIPLDRMVAAQWVYQFSILSFMMTMFTVPYKAAIIAHEKMNIFALVSIVEVTLKLLIVYLLVFFSFDKLKLYAVLMFGVTTSITFIYRTYSARKFKECQYSFYWEKRIFVDIISYSGWNLFGALAKIINGQGINILLNMFFGPVVNAARAIAYQINSAVTQFVGNFMTATRPQIIKYYAAGDNKRMLSLVFQSSKFSFLLLFILTMPVLLETQFVLEIWLKVVPQYVVLFTRLVIFAALIDSLSHSLMAAAQATGKIKKYQSLVGGVMLLNLPFSYLFLKFGYPADSAFYIAIVNSGVCLFLRILLLRQMVSFPIGGYFLTVILPLLIVSALAYVAPYIAVIKMNAGFLRFTVTSLVGLISSGLVIYIVGLSNNEKQYIQNFIYKLKQKYFR